MKHTPTPWEIHYEMLAMLRANEIAWDGEEDSVRSEHRALIRRLKAVIAKAEGVDK